MDKASILSSLTYAWARVFIDNPTVGYALPKDQKPDEHYALIKTAWEEELLNEEPSFFSAVMKAFGATLIWKQSQMLIDMLSQLAVGVCMGRLIYFLRGSGEAYWTGWLYGVVVFVCPFISAIARHYGYMSAQLHSAAIKQAILKLVNEKLLRLGNDALQGGTAAGMVMNVMTMDVDLYEYVFLLNYLWASPIFALFVSIVLYFVVGFSGLLGVAVICFLVPIQSSANRSQVKLRATTGAITDQRLKRTTELVDGIRALKLYGWEVAYTNRIFEIRSKEIGKRRIFGLIRASNMSTFLVAQGLACLVTFGSYSLMGHAPDSKVVFSALSLLMSAQFYLTVIFPYALEMFSTYQAGSARISTLLRMSEKTFVPTPAAHNGEIVIKDLTAHWGKAKLEEQASLAGFVLKEVNLHINPGELVVIKGAVGAGKSSLLLSMLGELTVESGQVERSGRVAYVEQEPWILSATIKDNITMGKSYDKSKFDEVIRVCALEDDMKIFPKREETMLGDRGVNISGGQKARLSLARAVYSDADIYLMDDPLSAVDVRVSRHLFSICLRQHLKGRTIVIVTHQIQFQGEADRVLVVNNGEVTEEHNFDKHVAEVRAESGPTENLAEGEGIGREKEQDKKVEVTFRTYYEFVKNGGWYLLPIFIVLYPATMLAYLAVPYWLSYWSLQGHTEAKKPYYIVVLAVIVLILLVLGLVRNNLFLQALLSSSNYYHRKAVLALCRSPTDFFDDNSTGMIMGRCSKDIGMIDDLLAWMFTDMMQVCFNLFGFSLAMMVGNPWVAIAFVPLFFILYKIYKMSAQPTQTCHVHHLMSKAPIFGQVNTTLTGLVTIRAFGLEKEFSRRFDASTSDSQRALISHASAVRWMQYRLDMVGIAYTAINVIIVLSLYASLDGTLLAIGLSMVLGIALTLIWAMQQVNTVDNFMASVYRIQEYAQLPPEAPLRTKKLLKVTEGKIEFRNVKLVYHGVTTALKDLSFTIQPMMKVGIVGRTGAGKTSVMQALFRLVEIKEGKILIDGQDVRHVGLHSLRRKISVIPQTPFIFSASVKYNLDPFNRHSDEDLWKVLEYARLRKKVESFPSQLEELLHPTSLSVGEKQLVCLARALIRNNKILLMDEATANVDRDTDSFIQDTVKQYFEHCTVITIAHRLDTIVDYDEVFVMADGMLEEHGPPRVLAADPDSKFADMIQSAGKHAEALLKKLGR